MTREEWLALLVEALRPVFKAHGAKIPAKVRVACGWPRSSNGRHKAIGQAWSPSCSADGTHETFISPELSDPVRVADVLVHELVHHAVGTACGHKGPFRKLAIALGLTGPMTATIAGPELTQRLHDMTRAIGPYPHATLSARDGLKKQTTRMLKVQCPACECTCRMVRQWLDDPGPPTCACGTPMIEA